jgi:hypothetical protein
MLEIINDKNEWKSALQQFHGMNDIYFDYDYFDIYKQYFNVDFEAVKWEDLHISVFWSHLIRDIPIKLGDDQQYFDLITPYGYGGPLIICKTNSNLKVKESLNIFMREYFEYAMRKKYVCEFIRFHPVIRNWELFQENFQEMILLDHVNDTIYIDLSNNLDNIWQGIRKGHKYNIKKTERDDCEIKILLKPSESDIDEFISLYYSTMDRCHALKKYYFPSLFIKDHFSRLSASIIRIEYGGQLIGSSMFLNGDSFVHYHLSGSDNTIRGIYPSEILIWNAIKWAKEKNFLNLHLGGGLRTEDSLFNFKKGFSKNVAPFYTGKIVFNNEQYFALTKANINSLNTNNGFFPSYRDEQSDTII